MLFAPGTKMTVDHSFRSHEKTQSWPKIHSLGPAPNAPVCGISLVHMELNQIKQRVGKLQCQPSTEWPGGLSDQVIQTALSYEGT